MKITLQILEPEEFPQRSCNLPDSAATVAVLECSVKPSPRLPDLSGSSGARPGCICFGEGVSEIYLPSL